MMRLVFALLLAVLAQPLSAQGYVGTKVDTKIGLRLETLFTLLGGSAVDKSAFTPTFLEQVPLDRLTALATELRTANGTVQGLDGYELEGRYGATIRVGYQQSVVTVRIAVEPAPPHRIVGLLVTGVTRRDDSTDKIVADLRALPGSAALLVARLGDGAPVPIVEYQPTKPLATGSQFKLFVFAELARQVAAGERKWSDVVPLGPPSLPSGVTQTWPAGAPVTLSTLATQMISISDNTAADTLVRMLGRRKLDLRRVSVGASPGSVPVLTTREAFVLKMTASSALRDRWEKGSLAERRALLENNAWPLAAIDPIELAGPPLHIDTIEWPASPREIVGVLDLLRRSGGHALDILAVNPALLANDRERFAYVGYKGGSETGAVALGWLLRTKDGQWYAVAGAWNDPNASVDTRRFTALLGRVVARVAQGL